MSRQNTAQHSGSSHRTAGAYCPSFGVVEAVLQQFTDAARDLALAEPERQGGGDSDREQSDGSKFHPLPVVGGVPITFNDVCASLATRKEITAVFSDAWHASPANAYGAHAVHGIGTDYTHAGWLVAAGGEENRVLATRARQGVGMDLRPRGRSSPWAAEMLVVMAVHQ